MDETYLGDGLDVSFDGWQVPAARAARGGDHCVYLDAYVLRAWSWAGPLQRGEELGNKLMPCEVTSSIHGPAHHWSSH